MAYKKAMYQNYGGLKLHDTHIANKPSSDFQLNHHVGIPSGEMTLSPYQKINSPAMHPFIPKSYQDEGGTSCGYGGRGVSYAHQSGAGIKHSRAGHRGHGLF
jgi:hypothetical protein